MKTIWPFCSGRMRFVLVPTTIVLAGLFLILQGSSAPAQSLAELSAGMAIQGDLNAQAVGPAMGPLGVGRARAVAGAAGSMQGTVPPPVVPGSYAPGGPPPAPVEGGAMPMGFAPAPYTPPVRVRAVEGRRVYDAVTYRMSPSTAKILDDPQFKEITDEKKETYSDDGRLLGDQVPNDGLYSRIEPGSYDEYTGGFSHFYARKTINLLRSAQELDVLEFFGLNAVTNERFSALEKERDLVADRNNRIYTLDDNGSFQDCWAKRFLDLFRIEVGSPQSDFFPLYVPMPPPPPAVPPPAGWLPPQAVKTPLEIQIDAALELYREAMAGKTPASELDKRVKELRDRLLTEDAFRTQFLTLYPAELPAAQPAGGGGGGVVEGGYYNVPSGVYRRENES